MKYLVHLLPLFLIVALALACSDQALATTDFDPWGSPGGTAFRDECPKGSYLVGVDGRYGAWVDRIAMVCAPWLPAQQTFGATSVGKLRGASRGGNPPPRPTTCSGFGITNRAVQALTVEILRSENKLVQSVRGYCTSLGPPVSTAKWSFGSLTEYPEPSTPYPLYFPDDALRRTHVCPPGELAVGIHGRAGLFVDALGLICGPLPVNPGAPATKVNPLGTAPEKGATKVTPLAVTPVTDDMFTIRKPADGDRVVQGQVVLLVKPPKIGTPPVTVLEFKYLDAPPTNPYSYAIAVETPKLLQDYVVPPQSQPAYGGHWQVQARTAGQPPGKWSLPVQFTLFVVQPTQSQKLSPSVPQTAPLPSTSVAQPPASSSTTTQMKRSPSMIMPRGVEEKGAGEPPPAPEKKP